MMPTAYVYHPGWFFFINMSLVLVNSVVAAFLSKKKGMEQLQMALLLFALCMPCVVALTMIFGSGNTWLIQDFWQRLVLFNISPAYLAVILFLMPLVVSIATVISLFFGYSADQFSITKHFSAIKGWGFLGMIIPLLLAPLIEELGWRGYGVDSLAAYFDLFTTSILCGLFWSLWHLPAFFVKGYYQNQLWYLGKIYALNFFVSTFVIAFVMNWVYYKTDRSIPALVLFHSSLNMFSMLFKTEQFTKCIVTLLLGLVALGLIIFDRNFFFSLMQLQ